MFLYSLLALAVVTALIFAAPLKAKVWATLAVVAAGALWASATAVGVLAGGHTVRLWATDVFLFGSDGIAFQELDIPAMDYNLSYTWVGGNDYIITDQYTPGYDNTQEGYAAFRASTVLQSGALVIN